MKKYLWVLLVAFALLVSGCSREIPTETEPATVTIPETTAAPETTVPPTEATYDTSEIDAYLASVKEESEALKYYLQYEAMIQFDMNEKSQDLFALWDIALNYLWDELKVILPEEKFAPLLEEQRAWITERENAMEEAGKEVEGGSMYSQVYNSEGAKWTEERVWELYALLQ